MVRRKRFAQYLLFLIVVLLYIYWGNKYGIKLKLDLNKTYSITDNYQYNLFLAVFPILFGIILGVPDFLRKLQLREEWVIDWLKLLVIGIPTLLLDLSRLLYMIAAISVKDNVGFFISINPFYEVMVMAIDNGVITLSGIVFGYIMISSFTKESSNIT